jgi:two-component system nitrate/nitrite response regulator NarL
VKIIQGEEGLMTPSMRIVLCDQHAMFSEAFESLLVRRGHEVVATLTHPHDLVPLVQQEGDGFADVVVTELAFPELNGSAAVSFVRACCPETPTAVLTGHTDVDMLRAALAAGAEVVALKTDGVDEVESLLLFLASPAVPPSHQQAVTMWSKKARALLARSSRSTNVSDLTDRELEVTELLTLGRSTTEIARELHVSVTTVRTHLQHVFLKCNVHSRIELMAYAMREGLVSGRQNLDGLHAS